MVESRHKHHRGSVSHQTFVTHFIEAGFSYQQAYAFVQSHNYEELKLVREYIDKTKFKLKKKKSPVKAVSVDEKISLP